VALQLGGWACIYAGDAARAIDYFSRALRLSPLDNRIFVLYSGLSTALIMVGRFEEAVDWAKKSVEINRLWVSGHKALASALANSGRVTEAREAAARVISMDPSYRLARTTALIKSGPELDRVIEGMRKAGIPD